MRKLLVAAALLLSFSSLAMAAKTQPLVVKSGSVEAVVDGKTQTFKAGDTIPEGAQLTAKSDAVIQSGGMVINAPAGASFQAARTDAGLIDVRANSGQLTVQGFGNTAVIPAGGEANVSGGNIQAIAGSISVTSANGNSQTITAGQQMTKSYVQGSYTNLAQGDNGAFASILPPPPPNPTQNNSVVALSGSAP